jgi:5-(carboxyamino)imidazole ribonucleotide synthase
MTFDRSTTIQVSAPSTLAKPVQRIGIIGGGQLAWMMSGAAQKLGIELIVQTPHHTDPAVKIAADTILASIDDATATAQLAKRCDIITFENEFVDLVALTQLAQQGICFRPGLAALSPLLDKYQQRRYLQALNLPVPRFAELPIKFFEDLEQEKPVSATPDLEQLTSDVDRLLAQLLASDYASDWATHLPLVLKTRRHGYDGQGTFILKNRAEVESTFQRFALNRSVLENLMVEEFVPFERELAVIAARSEAGEVVTYPIVETQQKNQVCHRVFAPANIAPAIAAEIEAIAHTLMNELQVVGVFGIELFLTSEGKVLINEIAPRVHNSGHFTLDACVTSQFEQHLRAVCGLPLGNPDLTCAGAVMVNLLGYEQSQSDYYQQRQQIAAIPQTHLHWYGKTESRPGRKLGHVTVLLDSYPPEKQQQQGEAIAQTIESIWYNF